MNITSLIVTCNRLDKLKKCLAATLALPFQSVVVVNNKSTDGTREWLDQLRVPRLHICHSEINDGGAGGFARGASYIAQHLSTDWVVFYDDDACPAPSFIGNFSVIADPACQLYCARVVDLHGDPCRMNIPWAENQATLRAGLKYLYHPQSLLPAVARPSEVVTFSFVGCIISFPLLKKTHELIDRDLFIYFDDVYYSYKLYSSGYKIRYHPDLLFLHDVPASGNPVSARKIYYLVRNLLLSRFILKENPFFSRTAIGLRIAKYMLLALKGPEKINTLRLLIKAVYHGVTNQRPII